MRRNALLLLADVRCMPFQGPFKVPGGPKTLEVAPAELAAKIGSLSRCFQLFDEFAASNWVPIESIIGQG